MLNTYIKEIEFESKGGTRFEGSYNRDISINIFKYDGCVTNNHIIKDISVEILTVRSFDTYYYYVIILVRVFRYVAESSLITLLNSPVYNMTE